MPLAFFQCYLIFEPFHLLLTPNPIKMSGNWQPRPTQRLHAVPESEATWGYVIYRTTCTPWLSTLFSCIISLLSSGIKNQFFSEYALAQKDKPECAESTLCLGTWAEPCRVIIADPAQFNQASIDSIDAHFESWMASQAKPDHSSIYWRCLIYDEKSRQAYLSAPLQDRMGGIECGENKIHKCHYVKPITAFSDSDDDEYDAFMGGERSDRKGIELIPRKNGIMPLSDSEDDEYDGFLGGFL